MARRYYTALLLVLLCLQAYSQTETQNPVFPFWKVKGNSGTNSNTNFLGTTDNISLRLRTNNTQRMVIDSTGNVGIGTGVPGKLVHVAAGTLLASGTTSSIGGIELIPRAVNTNGGGRIYFREDNDELFGFSVGFNGGNAGNEILNWPANTFAISTHTNNSTGQIAFSINRVTGNIGIGTGVATTKFHIAGTGSGVRVESVATGGSFITTPAASTDKLLYADANGDIRAIANGSSGQVLTITGGVPAWGAAGTSGWELTGNSGTTAGTNFLGTADAVDMVVKTNSTERMRVLANGYVGVNTNSPTNQLTVNGSASFGNLTNQINNVSSIAVGSNDTITSLGSIAVGDKVTATANACAIFGKESSVNGYGSLVSGRYANASGNHSVAFGYIDSALADGAFVANKNNTVRGNHATAFGTFNYAPSYGEFTIGSYSTTYTAASSTNINSSDRVFTIGIGTGSGSRADAMVVLKNGNTGVGTNAPARKLHIAGTGSGVRVESVAT
ncbi:MAG TPA: hypothetical protein PLW44_15135, partial [Chitinophagales bacterium]|nr:hypothetical protein [Chitinophagales bacterium]